MKITKRPILPKMKKNPRRVTMLGASHNGRTLTNAFHYMSACQQTFCIVAVWDDSVEVAGGRGMAARGVFWWFTYPRAKYVFGDG